MRISLRVTSRGNALVHEMKQPGTPDDPAKDDPITVLYLEGNRLILTHYCDAGAWPPEHRQMGKRWNSIFSMWPVARSTGTCTTPCSPSSTPTTTPRTGLTWNLVTSLFMHTSICSERSDGTCGPVRQLSSAPRLRTG